MRVLRFGKGMYENSETGECCIVGALYRNKEIDIKSVKPWDLNSKIASEYGLTATVVYNLQRTNDFGDWIKLFNMLVNVVEKHGQWIEAAPIMEGSK